MKIKFIDNVNKKSRLNFQKKNISACTFFPSLLAGKLATFKPVTYRNNKETGACVLYAYLGGKIYIVRAIHFKIAKQHWLTFFLRFAYVLICDLIQQILEENVIVWMNLVFTCLLLSCLFLVYTFLSVYKKMKINDKSANALDLKPRCSKIWSRKLTVSYWLKLS